MGVEAGTDRVLKIMNKQITLEQTQMRLLLKKGSIPVGTSWWVIMMLRRKTWRT